MLNTFLIYLFSQFIIRIFLTCSHPADLLQTVCFATFLNEHELSFFLSLPHHLFGKELPLLVQFE